jgi:hypothetical protein
MTKIKTKNRSPKGKKKGSTDLHQKQGVNPGVPEG